jgi:serine-type D-Ala-D-Ala carboxypeptidase (penicillin-binding protein 5/6)
VSQQETPDWFVQLSETADEPDGPSEPETPEQAAGRRRRRRRGLIATLISVVVVLALLGTYAGLTLTAKVGPATSAIQHPVVATQTAAQLVFPTVGEAAVSISGGDAYLGTSADGIFASSGGDGALPMASISKLITALVILQSKPLGASGQGPMITWTSDDAKLYDKYYLLNATIAAMPANSSMSEYNALETMLVVSACNYAEAMADWAFGSNANFIYHERLWLKANGLNSTSMVEPTGIDPANVSTPSDLITLGKIAMANPTIASIVAKGALDVPSLEGMPNTNDLLGVDGIDGIKTGTLEGSDLLFSATVSAGVPTPLTVTGIVLKGDSRDSVDDSVKALLSSISAGFHTVQLGTEGQVVGNYSTPWGSHASMVLGKTASVVSWSNTPITSTVKTTTLKTGASGETVGSVTWTAGKTTVTVPVVLRGKVAGPSTWWRLTHPGQLLK